MVLECLYNTVRDDDNADYVENNGPFLSGGNSWFGKGYYFWDSMLSVAHWWGQYHCKENIDQAKEFPISGCSGGVEKLRLSFNKHHALCDI